jgi:hypothetical protein
VIFLCFWLWSPIEVDFGYRKEINKEAKRAQLDLGSRMPGFAFVLLNRIEITLNTYLLISVCFVCEWSLCM